MRLLLDSHVALWWLEDSSQLGSTCRSVIQSADHVAVSAVTPWELGIKRALGKLSMPEGLVEQLRAGGFDLLSIDGDHAELAPTLPPHHRDPFDRMLIAQARLETLTLVTADQSLAAYGVSLIDARV